MWLAKSTFQDNARALPPLDVTVATAPHGAMAAARQSRPCDSPRTAWGPRRWPACTRACSARRRPGSAPSRPESAPLRRRRRAPPTEWRRRRRTRRRAAASGPGAAAAPPGRAAGHRAAERRPPPPAGGSRSDPPRAAPLREHGSARAAQTNSLCSILVNRTYDLPTSSPYIITSVKLIYWNCGVKHKYIHSTYSNHVLIQKNIPRTLENIWFCWAHSQHLPPDSGGWWPAWLFTERKK